MRKPFSIPPSLWREIVDSLSDAVVVFGSDLVPIAMNKAAESLFGVSHLNEAAVGAMLRSNEWLLRMVDSCLVSGQNVADADAKLSLGSRSASVSVEVSPMLAAAGTSRGA